MQNDIENRGDLKWLLWIRLLLLIAIAGAGYLAFVSITNGPVTGCMPGSGCDKVLQSRWAYWVGVPVSLPAVVVYLAMLLVSFFIKTNANPEIQRSVWSGMILLAVVVIGAAIWFVALQMFVIEAFCKFCMTTHACGLTASVLVLKHIPYARDPEISAWSVGPEVVGVPHKAFKHLLAVGVAGVMVLICGQLLVEKQRNIVKEFSGPTGRSTSAGVTNRTVAANPVAGIPTNGLVTPNVQIIAPHVMSLYDGRFLLSLDEVPMIGSPDAKKIIVNLYDYNCTHCRMLHPFLVEAQRRMGNQLGIVTLPMPMSTNCNPFVPADHPSFTNSCDYARLILGVWQARRSAYPQFEEWLFTGEKQATVAQATEYAQQLVGATNLHKAMTNEWIGKQLLMSCQLHRENWQATGLGPAMPQVIMGNAVSVGPLNSVNHLLVLLEKYTGIEILPKQQQTPKR
jgi:uncharacterized membrane protein